METLFPLEGQPLPHDRLAQFDRDSVEVGYDVQELGALYADFADELVSYPDSELFSLELHIARQLASRSSLRAYIAQERRRREMWERARGDE